MFHKRAPAVDLPALSDLITDSLIHPDTRSAAESVWIQNSFVDPTRGIDENETPSDLDVFVLIPEWELPVADTGLALAVPAVENPDPHPPTEAIQWESKDGGWTDTAEAFWETLPDHARYTFARSIQRGFYASEADREAGRVRNYDVTVGNRSHFEYGCESRAQIQIYPDDSLAETET